MSDLRREAKLREGNGPEERRGRGEREREREREREEKGRRGGQK